MALQAIYPDNLASPQVKPYSYAVDMGLLRTPMEGGNTRQRRLYRTMPTLWALEFIMHAVDLFDWQTWADANGYDWFQIDLQSMYSGAAGKMTSPHLVRFTTDLQMENIMYGWIRVRVSAELSPFQATLFGAPPAPGPAQSNWIIAGTPAAPSSDTVTAGTPGNPSSDTITAGTPAYPSRKPFRRPRHG